MKRSALSTWVTSAIHDRQIRAPWTDRLAILLRHHARGLRDVAEIVADPRREQLTKRHRSEFGMLARQLEILLLEVPPAQGRDIFRAQLVKLLQQILEGALSTEIKESIERIEADHFDDLPGEVFVRGFLKAYARAVGLAVEDVLARYTASRRVAWPGRS